MRATPLAAVVVNERCRRIWDAIQIEDWDAVRAVFADLSLADAIRCASEYGMNGVWLAKRKVEMVEMVVEQAKLAAPRAVAERAEQSERHAAIREAVDLLRMYELGAWPISVPAECMAAFGITYDEFNRESGRHYSLSQTPKAFVASARIEGIVRAERLKEVARIAASLRRVAPDRLDIIEQADALAAVQSQQIV
ncbi:hypothetical protein [Gemmata sp.]|uniref:hypothetical protein n=1 Tax=Gemmata sp. TaxID=1914242 RepID=UPI003F6EEABE